MRISFLGGVGTVTGSKYLVDTEDFRILVDCGLFQGFKNLRLRNRAPLPVDPASIDAVILTHAHIDHSGYLPLLVRNGFHGPVLSTPGTRELCGVLLPDSGFLQEKEAMFANRHGFSKHRPAVPLYTRKDAELALERFQPIEFDRDHRLGDALTVRFSPAGHILGAALVRITDGDTSLLFSGDLGRPNSPTMVAPATVHGADYLVIESTYGDRRHEPQDTEELLAEIVQKTASRGGTVLIPAFAVGRTQTILHHLARLKQARQIPDVPVYLDSPMAINASELYCRYVGEHRLTPEECRAACNVATYVRTAEESKALDHGNMPIILIAASGMATGGRVVHHLKRFAPDRRSTILFVGFQAGGTRGAAMVAGAESVKIHGAYVPVRAEVRNLHMLSAHADVDEIMGWLGGFGHPPKMTFVTHGEHSASDALRHRIEEQLGWECEVPGYRDQADLN